MSYFSEKEFTDICKRHGTKFNIEEVTIDYPNPSFFNKMRASVKVDRDRRGEVVFCVIRPNGKIVAVTCEEYPRGIFRIPTGGIGYEEDIIEAVYRESKEELGIDVEITDFIGVLKIKFQHNKESFMFYSYIFILKEISGGLLEDASDDEVSEVREVDVEGLGEIADALNSIQGSWSDWGRFRYYTSNAVYQYLKGTAVK